MKKEEAKKVEIEFKGKKYQALEYKNGKVRIEAFEKVRILKDHYKGQYSILTEIDTRGTYAVSFSKLLIQGKEFCGSCARSVTKYGDDAFSLAETLAISRAISFFLGLEVEIASVEELPETISKEKPNLTNVLKDKVQKKNPPKDTSGWTKTKLKTMNPAFLLNIVNKENIDLNGKSPTKTNLIEAILEYNNKK